MATGSVVDCVLTLEQWQQAMVEAEGFVMESNIPQQEQDDAKAEAVCLFASMQSDELLKRYFHSVSFCVLVQRVRIQERRILFESRGMIRPEFNW